MPDKISSLERRGTLKVLLYLLKAPEHKAMITYIKRETGLGHYAVSSAVHSLMKLGLVTEIISESFPYSREIKLTEKGLKVAKLLSQVEEVLER